MNPENHIVVIGGGASGLMAAITAAKTGATVSLCERLSRVGKKILVTGNGRCNFTNTDIAVGHYHGTKSDFVTPIFNQFNLQSTLQFFQDIGLEYRVEDRNRVFPISNQASSVLDVLRYELERYQVREMCNAEVVKIRKKKAGFQIIMKHDHSLNAKKIILAAGGKAVPNLGSNGSGFRLAQSLGHTIIPPFPANVQVCAEDTVLKRLKGVRIWGKASLLADDVPLESREGEILFTDYGLSGPPILELSRQVNESLRKKRKVVIKLDFFPNKSFEEMKHFFHSRFNTIHYKSIEDGLIGLLNKRFIPVFLNRVQIDKHKKCDLIQSSEIIKLTEQFKAFGLTITGTKSWSGAQVTAGGVDVNEIDARTLESKKTPGLFFAGEIVDIDGDCGGYNLQWAWSSGYVAGLHAAKKEAG